MEAFAAFGESVARNGGTTNGSRASKGWGMGAADTAVYRDSGTAARFFYSAKATASDRVDSKHPTVKPLALMKYLVQLVCPPNGTVLDPFAGTGSTGLAADQLGMNAILIEQSAEYAADARRKIEVAARCSARSLLSDISVVCLPAIIVPLKPKVTVLRRQRRLRAVRFCKVGLPIRVNPLCPACAAEQIVTARSPAQGIVLTESGRRGGGLGVGAHAIFSANARSKCASSADTAS